MMLILAILGVVFLVYLFLRWLAGPTPGSAVIIVTQRVEDDSKDKRNLGGGLGL